MAPILWLQEFFEVRRNLTLSPEEVVQYTRIQSEKNMTCVASTSAKEIKEGMNLCLLIEIPCILLLL